MVCLLLASSTLNIGTQMLSRSAAFALMLAFANPCTHVTHLPDAVVKAMSVT